MIYTEFLCNIFTDCVNKFSSGLFLLDGSSAIVSFLGRFHPLFVHFPIGFFVIVVTLEFVSRREKYEKLQHATTFILFLTVITAIISALLGYFLSFDGEYDETILSWHKFFGVALAAGTTITYIFKILFEKFASKIYKTSYTVCLGISFLFLMIAGHLGGTLTHGSDFITSALPDSVRQYIGLPPKSNQLPHPIANIQQAVVYPEIIQPVFNERCIGCHNPLRKKGGLLLNNKENILKGGKNGKIIAPGNPLKSSLYKNLLLPKDDDKHMPPDGKAQLTKAQVSIIRWWIEQGAPFDKKVAELRVPDTIKTILAKYSAGKKRPEGIFVRNVAAADTSAINNLSANGLKATLIARDYNYLEVSFMPGRDTFTLNDVDALNGISNQLAWLNLSGKKTDPEALASLTKFPNLSRLHLENSNIEDSTLRKISNLQNLEYLNLYGTSVTDNGVKALVSLKKLRSLYLWQTKVSVAEADKLKITNPKLNVNMGL